MIFILGRWQWEKHWPSPVAAKVLVGAVARSLWKGRWEGRQRKQVKTLTTIASSNGLFFFFFLFGILKIILFVRILNWRGFESYCKLHLRFYIFLYLDFNNVLHLILKDLIFCIAHKWMVIIHTKRSLCEVCW